jgi:hypothetical protein
LCAVVPNGRYVGRSSSACQVSTQSPAGVDVGDVGAHATVDHDRAVLPEGGSGRLRQRGVGSDACGDHHDVRGAARAVVAEHPQLGAISLDGLHGDTGRDRDAVLLERVLQRRSQLGVNGGEDLVEHLDDSDVHPAVGEGVGEFEADVARAGRGVV